MCDSATELTEVGVEEAAKDAANKAKWAKIEDEGEPPSDEEMTAQLKALDDTFNKD
jgi:hypothetical protein